MTDWIGKALGSKRATHDRLRQLPSVEKTKLPEKLRERSLLMARARTQRGVEIPLRRQRPT